ncbi:hypothetical protein KOW79_021036 [Hemibagrus wyckioides]|uniref:Uncharacterized protein n=1 Tax=Hemibagrus wyckioides TaxID=337641 RepID=A0A9D3N7Z0_9TELE|nr:hypothetical protein KOW79_021036 [Hemibagrus wyckioides]
MVTTEVLKLEVTECDDYNSLLPPIVIPMRKMQVLRLKVQSDGAGFDPASVLDLVQQKVKERRMLFNTTVSFRVTRDGQIFIKRHKHDP